MKALTIRQPWASLIAAGVKTIETRSWSTKHRGPIAIHTGSVNPADGLVVGRWSVYRQVDGSRALDTAGGWHPLPLGCVVATADLVDCVPMVDADEPVRDHHEAHERWLAVCPNVLTLSRRDGSGAATRSVHDQRPFGDFAPGRWAWLLDNVQRIQPVPARGKQGLWNWEPS